MNEKVYVQIGDLAAGAQTVIDLATGRMQHRSDDLNVLLDQADTNMEMAVVAMEGGNLPVAASCAEQAASCALLVAVAMRRMARDIPPVQEMN
ncbi:hypothetical protein K6L44_10010 [Gluconacetobacter entanii]|uniref:hypothetical protein n=1 Tax=Gluconacetobacter entanii TaxID=108528 RepID=UPI001C935A16|nr:hypothetical protein [Gluconacetobacter entanii]MBY4640314.1 hypothetical protein [Gluconacetobacter entanii]MCW4579912.1 hypothetical protein [Gluconacetobacter entanii]MCW4584625.1 hypothetical protein [Gluconacetobacter entanii]MCW4588113.1 hypothetical protein [Gluconacetobacter entanii]